jgi:dTDP-4-dehydrorhamnose reductase
MMKYLVTGASGQLGCEWVDFFKKKKISFLAYKSAEMDVTDVTTVQSVMEKEKPDVVINCAAYTKVDDAESHSEQAYLVNETGVKNLAESCRKTGSKLVHYSTDYVFSGHKNDQKIYPDGYPEDAPADPVNVYGDSKRAGERILENSEIDWLLIRVSWLCGQYGNNFVKTMLKLAAQRDELDIVNDQTGSPAYAFDVVDKSYQLIEKKYSGIFHIASTGAVTWAGFAGEIFSQTGHLVKINRVSSDQFPRTAKRPEFSLLSTRKAEKAGLTMINWKKGLSHLLHQAGNNTITD